MCLSTFPQILLCIFSSAWIQKKPGRDSRTRTDNCVCIALPQLGVFNTPRLHQWDVFSFSFFSKVHKAGCELTSYLAHRNTGTVGLTESHTSKGGGEVPLLPACSASDTLSRGPISGAPEKLPTCEFSQRLKE